MGKTVHVFSTLATDQRYVNYDHNPQGVAQPISDILIKGGAGVANDRLITPDGVATEIPVELVAALEANPVFQIHKKNGYITVRDRKADADKVATDMNGRDPSKPLTPADYQDAQVDAVVSGGTEVASKADGE